MEITKQNETFNLKETTDVYEMNGTVSREALGGMNMNINVSRIGGDRLGDCFYNRYSDNANVHFSMNCSEENRIELATYATTVIDSVLEYFEANK